MSTSTVFPEKSNTTRRAPRGQSFIEAMVAITVIISSISSSMTLVTSSLTSASNSGSQVAAANLAREGIEVVRAARDSNWLKSQSFQVGLVDSGIGGNKTARPILSLSTGAWTTSFASTTLGAINARVYLTNEGVYLQADSQPTDSVVSPYSRNVTLQPICRDNASGVESAIAVSSTAVCNPATETTVGLLAASTVRWKGVSSQFRTLTVEERLYDWR